jgi:hypothetical protein
LLSGHAGPVRASRTRFSTRGPRSRRGTVVTVHLRAPATVVFSVRGPSPSCSVAGSKAVHGRRGVNRVRLTGRFDGRPLAPGTYRIDVIARRHGSANRIGAISVQVVPARRLQRSSGPPPVFFCVPASQALPAALPGPAAGERPAGPSSRRRVGHASVKRSGGVSVPLIYGSAHSFWNLVLDLISYAGLALLGAVLLIRTVRYVRDH